MPLRLVFMGTPDFAVPTLLEIVGRGHDVAAVYTRAPKPAGRGQQERRTPVHELALSLELAVRTPKGLRSEEEAASFRALDLDAAVVVSYGHILPKAFLEASVRAAADRGGRFSIVTGGERWKPMLARLAVALGFGERLASIRTIALTGGQVAENPDAALATLASACAAAADEDGADEVILGGAGLAGLAEQIAPRVWVPVLDSVLVGARRAAALARTRGETPSIGLGDPLARLLR